MVSFLPGLSAIRTHLPSWISKKFFKFSSGFFNRRLMDISGSLENIPSEVSKNSSSVLSNDFNCPKN